MFYFSNMNLRTDSLTKLQRTPRTRFEIFIPYTLQKHHKENNIIDSFWSIKHFVLLLQWRNRIFFVSDLTDHILRPETHSGVRHKNTLPRFFPLIYKGHRSKKECFYNIYSNSPPGVCDVPNRFNIFQRVCSFWCNPFIGLIWLEFLNYIKVFDRLGNCFIY